MVFKKEDAVYAVQIERKGEEDVLYVNYLRAGFVPSLADDANVMARTIDALSEHPEVSAITFVQQKNYYYPHEQVLLLSEIAGLINYFEKTEAILSPEKISLFSSIGEIGADLTYFMTLMRQDPLKCYGELGAKIKKVKSIVGAGNYGQSILFYLRVLEKIHRLLGECKLVSRVLDFGGSLYGRSSYAGIFRPDILPNFTFTRLVAKIPENAELIDQYEIENHGEKIIVNILKREDDAKYIYHASPPEYLLSEEHHALLSLARNVLIEHRPKAEELTNQERTRQVFFNIGRDLISELAKTKGIVLSYRELERMARILVRHTIGFGLIEILLSDSKLQDVVLNAPIAQNPVFVRHQDYDECVTNIIPSQEDADSWAAKLRMQSGRPLDEANPVLDSDLSFGNTRARVAAITLPLSPSGLSYAIRRHRDQPWTLPLFIEKKMLNSFSAGLLSFLIDGARTILVAGTRSSGKSSLLGSLMLEIMPKFRVITLEDTLELPVDALRKIGYDILRMKVRSALVQGTTEVEASEGIRTSLRLGDSALIVGEVRSAEAKALYEAMRVGALANVVAGTIHGDSPYGVFDRVVNDLGVPITSFKATDLIAIANPVKTADGMHSQKRLVKLTEVKKHWTKDPEEEGGFVDLLRYNVEKDELEPSAELINGDSDIIKSIASQVKGWAGNWDAVYDNILLRAKVKQEIVETAHKMKKPEIMEARFNSLSNSAFHRISEKIAKEVGLPVSERVFPSWKQWFLNSAERF